MQYKFQSLWFVVVFVVLFHVGVVADSSLAVFSVTQIEKS